MDKYKDSFVQYIDESKQYHASLVKYMDKWINIKTVEFNVLMNPSNTIFLFNISTNGLI